MTVDSLNDQQDVENLAQISSECTSLQAELASKSKDETCSRQDIATLAQSLARGISAKPHSPQDTLIPADFLVKQCQKLPEHETVLTSKIYAVSQEILKLKRDKIQVRRLIALDKLRKRTQSPWQKNTSGCKSRDKFLHDEEFLAKYEDVPEELLDELLELDLELESASAACGVSFDHLSHDVQLAYDDRLNPARRMAKYFYLLGDYEYYLAHDSGTAYGSFGDKKCAIHLYKSQDRVFAVSGSR